MKFEASNMESQVFDTKGKAKGKAPCTKGVLNNCVRELIREMYMITTKFEKRALEEEISTKRTI